MSRPTRSLLRHRSGGLVGEVPVDVAGDRRSRGDKITPDQARPMRLLVECVSRARVRWTSKLTAVDAGSRGQEPQR
jgi:hypothetical protein